MLQKVCALSVFGYLRYFGIESVVSMDPSHEALIRRMLFLPEVPKDCPICCLYMKYSWEMDHTKRGCIYNSCPGVLGHHDHAGLFGPW